MRGRRSIRLDGDPVGTLPFWAFLILTVLGLLMMFLGYKGAAAWAIIEASSSVSARRWG